MSEIEQNQTTPTPAPRRRRKPRRPKWVKNKFTYQLWRNWPLIRFVLLCLLALIIAISAVSCAAKAIGGLFTKDPAETTEPLDTTPVQTTVPPETEPPHDELLRQADFLAAGYDYERAIAMLSSSSHASSTDVQERIARYQSESQTLVKWGDMQNITHVFFHTLVVDNDRCFDGDFTEKGYNQYMTTIPEFLKMMESMYEKGYILVSPYDIAYEYVDENGKTRMKYGELWLPEGKIPFVMSQDDVNYYGYMIGDVDPTYERPAVPHADGDGFAHKIIIGEDGYPTCEYMDANGQIHVGDYDLVPILEKFIQEHPDFSYRGARAILGMTGYEGVFGYRTKPSYQPELDALHAADPDKYPSYEQEVADAKAVAQCLRDHGWILASHSYGHPAYGNISAERVEADSDKWEATVESIIGETDIILYPHGSDIHTWRQYTFENEKFAALYEDGYRYFFNVDGNSYWNQLGPNYFRGGRRNLDGYRMWQDITTEDPTKRRLDDLFRAEDVFDEARPTPVADM